MASPADTAVEKRIIHTTIDDINRTQGREEGFRIDLLDWKNDAYPGIGADGQDVINRQIGDYDILLVVMSTRYGSPTGRATSGTVEEFDRAWARFVKRPQSVRIMLYFGNAQVRLSEIDGYDLLQLQRFRRRVQDLGILHWSYDDANEIGIHLRNHLPKTIREILSGSVAKISEPARVASETEATSRVALGSWRTRGNIYPQGADYLPIALEKYSPQSFLLAGNLYTDSGYFRFGFKLFAVDGKEFGDSAIQSAAGANLLVHVGKNIGSDVLFLTSYYNGVRQGPNQPLLNYNPPRPLPVAIQVSSDNVCTMRVDGAVVHRLHINPTIAKRLIVVAWGDEHDFGVSLSDIVLSITEFG